MTHEVGRIRIAASLAAAPLPRVLDIVRELEEARVDMLHFDVEDGVFVPSLTLGVKLVADLRPLTSLPFDVHLMMVNPEWILPLLRDSGTERITVHVEACAYPLRMLGVISQLGMSAGLALNAATALPDLRYLEHVLHHVNIQPSEPDSMNGTFLTSILDKIRLLARAYPALDIIADGGITERTVGTVVAAGASTIVVGRYLFEGDSVHRNLEILRAQLNGIHDGQVND